MQYPKPKVTSKFGSGLVRAAVIYYLIKLFDGRFFDERRGCPRCGSSHVVRFDWEKRVFCKVIPEDGVFKDIVVLVKRFICRACNVRFYVEAPFYEKCNYGKPIVDLCLALAASNPFNRVETILMSLGI